MPQTTVGLRQPKWLAEGQYGSTAMRRVDGALTPAVCGIASGVLPFGRIAVLDPATNVVTAVSGVPAAGSVLIIPVLNEKYGIPLAQLTAFPSGDLQQVGTIVDPAVGYPPGSLVDYITAGDIVMWTEEAVNIGDPVFYRYTAGAGVNTVLGRVRKTVDGALTPAAATPTLRFAEPIATAGLVLVRVFAAGISL